MTSWQDLFARDFSLDKSQIRALEIYLELIVKESDRNLTAVTTEEKILDVHFRDSLSLLQLPQVSAAEDAVDVGSGAGFPGMVMAIARPNLHVTLLDSNKSRCSFMSRVAELAGLNNLSVLPLRAEDASRSDLRDSFSLALARAVGPLSAAIEYTAPLVKKGGYIVLQRGSRAPGDQKQASDVASLLSASLDQIVPITPYQGAKNLHVWIFSKAGATPSAFPRKSGMAKKRPLSGK